MTTTRDLLISELSKIPTLNNRYTNVNCINYPPPPGEEKRGNFSLVFKAIDNTTGERVAIKFMDPDGTSDVYRIDCFKREPKIIKQLNGKKRCLQLIEELQKFNLEIITASGSKFPMPFEFFSTDWIEDDIDDYFLAKEDLSPIEKLKLFRLIVLAIEAIHNNYIFHRDLKPDNIRSDNKQGTLCAYVIDFGTAAQFDSKKILPGYSAQVGASLYSAPEAFLGFAGERGIAKITDFYALGCILYELFNKQLYFDVLINKNTNFLNTLSVLALELSRETSIENKLSAWETTLEKLKNTVKPPDYLEVGCSLPGSISDLITGLFENLIIFDFNKRLTDFDKIRRIVDTAILVLQNDKLAKKRNDQKRLFKENKIKNIKEKEDKLSSYQTKKGKLLC